MKRIIASDSNNAKPGSIFSSLYSDVQYAKRLLERAYDSSDADDA